MMLWARRWLRFWRGLGCRQVYEAAGMRAFRVLGKAGILSFWRLELAAVDEKVGTYQDQTEFGILRHI